MKLMVAYITHSFIALLGVALFVFYKCASPQQDKLLLIGILSAPEHFELRDAIRKTWIRYIGNDILYYFLIGEHLCHIPVEDRIDEFTCKESAIFIPAVSDNGDSNLLQSGALTCYDKNNEVPVYPGYAFTVQHDIIIQRLGVLSDLCKQTVQVSLIEAATGLKITSATYSVDEPFNSSSILWKPVEHYRLPKGFEGRVVLEGNAQSRDWHRSCGFNWNSSGNILAYHMLWSPIGQPVHYDHNSLSAVAIGFELADIDNLTNFLARKSQRRKQWNERVSYLKQKLHEESSKMGDILFLNVVDVYRSLPEKMLHFYEWADRNVDFSYMLKTDDDTFVNIPQVMKELHAQSSSNKEMSTRIWWWSTFRQGWPVHLSGKWRESSYHSITYPPFPCGAGYVLSQGAIRFLSKSADELYTEFQGEDVALGIWLAGTNPHSTPNRTACSWACEDPQDKYSCNYPQLSVDEMFEIYQKMQDE